MQRRPGKLEGVCVGRAAARRGQGGEGRPDCRGAPPVFLSLPEAPGRIGGSVSFPKASDKRPHPKLPRENQTTYANSQALGRTWVGDVWV